MTANEPALLRQCKGVRTTVSCRVWAVLLFGSFNTFVFLQTLLHSCATDFLLSNTTAAIATELNLSAIAVVCSKHSPSTQQPQTQLRCVRLSFTAIHYLNEKKKTVWATSETQRTASPHSFSPHIQPTISVSFQTTNYIGLQVRGYRYKITTRKA